MLLGARSSVPRLQLGQVQQSRLWQPPGAMYHMHICKKTIEAQGKQLMKTAGLNSDYSTNASEHTRQEPRQARQQQREKRDKGKYTDAEPSTPTLTANMKWGRYRAEAHLLLGQRLMRAECTMGLPTEMSPCRLLPHSSHSISLACCMRCACLRRSSTNGNSCVENNGMSQVAWPCSLQSNLMRVTVLHSSAATTPHEGAAVAQLP